MKAIVHSPHRHVLIPSVLLIALGVLLFALPLSAAEMFDKLPGSWYVGGGGTTPAEILRGRADSAYYAKAAAVPGDYYEPDPTRVIYGDDDRVDVYTVVDPNLLKLSDAACVVVSTGEITNNGNGTYTLSTSAWNSQGGLPLCSGEPFAGQQQIGFCSGFLVGDSILVTAGHCVSSSDCGSVAFIFDFKQIDATTGPLTVIPEDNVYFCSEIIDWAQAGDLDHSVVRLDRQVVGREPIPVRRTGLVDNGDSLVVVGHPTVLPMKIAGGAIVQDNNGSTAWFQANLDTYGGNSGSMVVNTSTWTIEGILVRGAPDFVNGGGCAESNRVPNTGNTGSGLEFEEVSKTTAFASFIPELVNSTGEVKLNAALYNCSDDLTVEVRDIDLAGSGSVSVDVTTTAGDTETILLTETGVSNGIFNAAVATSSGAPVASDGTLQVADGGTVTATYSDADDGSGSPAVVNAVSDIDCVDPAISGVTVTDVGGTWAEISFTTDELASGTARGDVTCGTTSITGAGGATTTHTITMAGLSPLTTYYFGVTATDLAGNTAGDDNGGGCYSFTTLEQADYFTEQYTTGETDLAAVTITFSPDGSGDYYGACKTDTSGFPIDPSGGTPLDLGDDSTLQVTLSGGTVSLYGQSFSSVYVCSNGYITLGGIDDDYSETLEEHFAGIMRVSAYWDDFNPLDGGTVSYQELADRLVVTWDGIPEFNTTNSNSFQLEMYFDGTIAITLVSLASTDGLVGLSQGQGLPSDFIESDMSAYPGCLTVPPGCCIGEIGNILLAGECNDPDQTVDIGDLTNLINHLFVSFEDICCVEEADMAPAMSGGSPDGVVDVGDLTALIDHLFISFPPLTSCP